MTSEATGNPGRAVTTISKVLGRVTVRTRAGPTLMIPQTIPAPENVTKREADPVLGDSQVVCFRWAMRGKGYRIDRLSPLCEGGSGFDLKSDLKPSAKGIIDPRNAVNHSRRKIGRAATGGILSRNLATTPSGVSLKMTFPITRYRPTSSDSCCDWDRKITRRLHAWLGIRHEIRRQHERRRNGHGFGHRHRL